MKNLTLSGLPGHWHYLAICLQTLGRDSMISRCLIGFIKLYQLCVSPLLGPRCRFYPSCSRYACACLEKDPFPLALKKISRRLLSCHPWHPGGVDLP